MRAAVRVPAVVAAAAVLANHGAAGTPGQTLMARIIPAPGSLMCAASAVREQLALADAVLGHGPSSRVGVVVSRGVERVRPDDF